MSIKDDLENLEESVSRLHGGSERQEDVVTQFRIDQSGINSEFQTDIKSIKESLRTLILTVDKFHGEFANQSFKIVLWCVGMVLGIIGLVAVVWKAATSI